MIKVQLVCQKCGNPIEICAKSAEESYYDNFGYLEESSPEAIAVAIQKILYEFENKPFQCFEFV